MGEVTGKTWTDYSEPRIMAADLDAIEAGIVQAQVTADSKPDIAEVDSRVAAQAAPAVAAAVAAQVPPTVDAAMAPHIAQVQEISGLTGEDEAVALLVRTPGTEVEQALSDTLVASPVVGRIVAVREDEPTPTLLDGDLVVRYKVAGLSYFTDFSEYTTGQHPSDWSAPWVAGEWAVVEDAAATGGKLLQRVTSSSASRRGLAWDAVATDPDRADVEVMFKWRGVLGGIHGYGTVAGMVRGGGAAGAETLYRAGAGAIESQTLQRYNAGAIATLAPADGSKRFEPGWFITRFRVSGADLGVRTWSAESTEPTTWDLASTDSQITAPGHVGLFFPSPGQQDIDWVAIATGGRTAAVPT